LVDEERDREAEASKRSGPQPPPRWVVTGWTAEQDALLGTDRDGLVAFRIGKTKIAVTTRRVKLGIPAAPGGVNYWSAEDLALLGTDHDEAVAAKLKRSVKAVQWQRHARGIPVFVDRRTR
jgi:hypothetical protein